VISALLTKNMNAFKRGEFGEEQFKWGIMFNINAVNSLDGNKRDSEEVNDLNGSIIMVSYIQCDFEQKGILLCMRKLLYLKSHFCFQFCFFSFFVKKK